MTAELVNVAFAAEIQAFRMATGVMPASAIACALADIIRSDQPGWTSHVGVHALLHALNKHVHGDTYLLDGVREQARLEELLENDLPTKKRSRSRQASGKPMKKIKQSAAKTLDQLLLKAKTADERRIYLKDQPPIDIHRGTFLLTMYGLVELMSIGILLDGATDRYACKMEFVVYRWQSEKNKNSWNTWAYPISLQDDNEGVRLNACRIASRRIIETFPEVQATILARANQWLAEVSQLGYAATMAEG